MHSGGAQKCAQRSQPAQSVFLGVTTGKTIVRARGPLGTPPGEALPDAPRVLRGGA